MRHDAIIRVTSATTFRLLHSPFVVQSFCLFCNQKICTHSLRNPDGKDNALGELKYCVFSFIHGISIGAKYSCKIPDENPVNTCARISCMYLIFFVIYWSIGAKYGCPSLDGKPDNSLALGELECCDMTCVFVWFDSFIYVYSSDLIHSYMCIRVIWFILLCVTWLFQSRHNESMSRGTHMKESLYHD